MYQNNNLFELIKSLDKNERRYFRLFAARQEGSKYYLELFDEIDKQTEYDEAKLRKTIGRRKLNKNFAFNKNYLRKIIFRSLEAYNADSSVDIKIQSLIIQCKILFSKTLYKQYFASLEKAKQLALKHERFGYWLEILEMDKMITRKQELRSIDDDSLYDEAMGVLDKIKNTLEYSKIIRRLLFNYRDIGTSRLPEHKKLIENILSDKYMAASSKALSSKAKMTYYRINEIIENITANQEAALSSVTDQLNLVETNPAPFQDFIIDFRTEALSSMTSINLKLNKIHEAEEGIRHLKQFKIKDLSDKISLETSIVYLELELNLAEGNTDKLITIAAQLERLLVIYKDKIELDFELLANFKIISAFINAEEFGKALVRANFLLSHPLLVTRPDIESYCRVLNLIIHYELDNFELLPYLIRSTYRYLLKSKKLYKLENLIISFLRKLSKVKENEDLLFNLNNLRKEMIILLKDKFEKNAFEYFDFLRWIEKRTSAERIRNFPLFD